MTAIAVETSETDRNTMAINRIRSNIIKTNLRNMFCITDFVPWAFTAGIAIHRKIGMGIIEYIAFPLISIVKTWLNIQDNFYYH